MGGGEDQKRMMQAQTLFDISDRFGAFAAGIDPRTGERVQGSPAAQFAAAASGLGGQINQRVAAQDQQDRALRVAALQGAAGEFSAERADQRAAARAAAAGEKDRALGSLFDILDADGNVVQQGVPIATQGEYARLIEQNPGIRIIPSQTGEAGFGTTTLFGPDGNPVTFNTETAAGRADANAALGQGYTTEKPVTGPSKGPVNVQMPDGTQQTVREDDPRLDDLIAAGGTVVSRTAAQVESALIQPDAMDRYGRGQASPEETARIQDEIAQRLKSVWNPETGQFERPAVTPLIRQAEERRVASGLPTVMTFGDEQEPVSNVDEGLSRLSQFGEAAFGTGPALANIVNKTFALVDANAPFPDQMEGINIVNTLNETATLAFRDMTSGRPAQDAVNQFAQLSPAAASFTGSPDAAASQIRALLDLWNRELRQSQTALSSGILSPADRAKVQAGVDASADMIAAYQALLDGIQRGGTGGAARPNPADFRR
jgi:hypothetical protein